MVKKIAVLTSGGDAPGMNACLRAVIRAGLYAGKDMYVIYDGLPCDPMDVQSKEFSRPEYWSG